MSDHELRELLRDLANDETATDLAGAGVNRAWVDGTRRRNQGRLAVAAVAASTVAVGAGAAVVAPQWLGEDARTPLADRSRTSAPTPTPTTAPSRGDSSDAARGTIDTNRQRVQGVDVYVGPTTTQELALPHATASYPLPYEISLAHDVTDKWFAQAPIARAIAAVAMITDGPVAEVLLIGDNGERRWLDVSRLKRLPEEPYEPVNTRMLSPDGTRLTFAQPDGLLGFDLRTGRWAPAQDDGRATNPQYEVQNPFNTDAGKSGDPVVSPYSSAGSVAQGWWGAPRVELPDGSGTEGGDFIAMTFPINVGRNKALVFDSPGLDGRWKLGINPVAWLSEDELVYESRKATPQLISWEVGTDQFREVSRIIDLSDNMAYVASWALPTQG